MNERIVYYGRVFDVAVDIRKGSTNLRKACVVVLTEGDYQQFFISRGFVHEDAETVVFQIQV